MSSTVRVVHIKSQFIVYFNIQRKVTLKESYVKVGSHDPIFGANYYSDSKKLVMRIKISMS